MGLAALRKILEPQPFDPALLSGRTLAIDADNLLWTFATSMREPPTAPDGRPVAFLIGLVNRLVLYAKWGARSVWVYDGEQPSLKAETLLAREEARKVDAPFLSDDALEESKRLLSALGVPWLVAPGESDAQCAHFARSGIAWAAVTQDYDAALHGSPRTLRNLSESKTRPAESIELPAALERIGITREQLVDAAILIGTDYNRGVPGVGPVKAVKLVQKHGDLRGALDALGAVVEEDVAVRWLFLQHPVRDDVRPEWRAPDEAAVQALLRDAGLSEERGRKLVDAVARLHG